MLYKITLDLLDRATARLAEAALAEVILPTPEACSSFEEDKLWRVEAYYAHQPDAVRFQEELSQLTETMIPPVDVMTVPNENWVALSQAALPPVRAGRFTVYGSHDKGNVAAGRNSILIDAGEAFGTAHHATTSGCLRAIDRFAQHGKHCKILDLGTGSGILAIALARALPKCHIAATDVDICAVEVAIANAAANKVGPQSTGQRLQIFVASGLDHPNLYALKPFDLVVANILAGPLIALAKSIAMAVRNSGILVLSGILVEQAAEVSAHYIAHGFVMLRHERDEGWSTLVMRMAKR
ncbi:MAG: 50S ribosomal protein L11 methyltransferase [Hyphomicrobiaceae bacterium]